MAHRKLSESEFTEIRDWFFNKGFDSDLAGERIALIEMIAEREEVPEIDVHRRLTEQ